MAFRGLLTRGAVHWPLCVHPSTPAFLLLDAKSEKFKKKFFKKASFAIDTFFSLGYLRKRSAKMEHLILENIGKEIK